MKVRIERSGGVTGIGRVFELDAATLTPARAAELASHVAAARLGSIPPVSVESGGADRFVYRITVETGGVPFVLTASEGSAGPELLALIEWVRAHTR
jgi:hypothetical protein